MTDCEDCNATGLCLVWEGKRAVMDNCPRCDGVGKRHVCDEPECVNRKEAKP